MNSPTVPIFDASFTIHLWFEDAKWRGRVIDNLAEEAMASLPQSVAGVSEEDDKPVTAFEDAETLFKFIDRRLHKWRGKSLPLRRKSVR